MDRSDSDTDERKKANRRPHARPELVPQRSEGLIEQSGPRFVPPSASEPPPVARHSSGRDAWKETAAAAPDTSGAHSDHRRYEDFRSGFAADFAAHRVTTGAHDRTFAQAEPNYRAGFDAGLDLRYDGRRFEEIEEALHLEYETSTRETPTAEHEATAIAPAWKQIRAEIRCGFDAARAH